VEPRVLLVTDPRTDAQPLTESAYVNVPTMAFCHTDSPTRLVDIAIPANNKGKQAVGLLYWLLAREVLYLRGTPALPRGQPWDVMVDLFFYRDPEEAEKEEKDAEEAALAAQRAAAADAYALQNAAAAAALAPSGLAPATTLGGVGYGGELTPGNPGLMGVGGLGFAQGVPMGSGMQWDASVTPGVDWAGEQ